MTNSFVAQIDVFIPDKEDSVYDSIFKEYERVVIQSLIASFGLDFLVRDQHGGDVDTIHNVRLLGKDSQLGYKNKTNEDSYNKREEYNKGKYHAHDNYKDKKRNARKQWQATGEDIKDEYTGKYNIGFHGKTKAVLADKKVELDHILECKAIHEDRGRILSGLSGVELANSEENLAFTNKSLNGSMGKWGERKNAAYKKRYGWDAPIDQTDMVAYIKAHPELDEETKKNMLSYYIKARRSYEAKINLAYYTSSVFIKDTTKAMGKVGIRMGVRQVLGLIFGEIWFAVRDKIKASKENGEVLFRSIANGIKQGLENAMFKYKELWQKFVEGTIAGALASLTTTLCNIFFTTAKSVVRIVRQTWASLVEATKILLFNPDSLSFGERFRAASKIIATGASVVVGSMISELIAKTGIGVIPVVGDIVQTFCGTFVTGIMSCSLLWLLDKNSTVEKIVKVLNTVPTIEDFIVCYRLQAQMLEEYCAKLMDIDLERFQQEAQSYWEAVNMLENANNQQGVNFALKNICSKLGLPSPFGIHTNIDDFMTDKNNTLTFC